MDEQPEHWEGDDGKRPGGGARLEEFGLTGAVPAELDSSRRWQGCSSAKSADERIAG